MGRAGPRIRPRDEDVGGHPAESPPGSRQRMSGHAVGWFIRNIQRKKNNININFSGRITGGRTPGKSRFFPGPQKFMLGHFLLQNTGNS